jgi:hypothetical protein
MKKLALLLVLLLASVTLYTLWPRECEILSDFDKVAEAVLRNEEACRYQLSLLPRGPEGVFLFYAVNARRAEGAIAYKTFRVEGRLIMVGSTHDRKSVKAWTR